VRTINGTRADELLNRRLVTRQRAVIPLWVSLIGVSLRGVGRGLVWSARRWSISAPLLLLTVVYVRWDWPQVVELLAAVLAAGAAWWWIHPVSFRWVVAPAFGNWRLTVKYRRRWRAAMLGVGLLVTHQAQEYLPVIRRARSTRWTDTLSVRLLHGQTPERFALAAEGLRHVYGAHRCTVRETKPGWVAVRFYARDPLVHVVPVIRPDPVPDLAALPLGLTEEGECYRLCLLGGHFAVVAATGGGKSGVLWDLILSLGPLIRSGAVELWVIDPKGGMEMIFGRPLFARYEDTDLQGMAVLLEDAVAAQDARTQRLKGTTRQHVPSPDDPYVIVLVDEIASLTGYVNDRDLKRRIHTALSLLLSKGRAPGFSVVAALQDPRKDVLPFRDLIPTRIALRLSEPEQVAMALSDTARDRGARCDLIPRSLPGVGYVIRDDDPTPIRVRFAHVSDDDIRAAVHQWAPASWPDRITAAAEPEEVRVP
jgi:S-DNA-T family DNA segregation ATPase FtsK/SpoIIIE